MVVPFTEMTSQGEQIQGKIVWYGHINFGASIRHPNNDGTVRCKVKYIVHSSGEKSGLVIQTWMSSAYRWHKAWAQTPSSDLRGRDRSHSLILGPCRAGVGSGGVSKESGRRCHKGRIKVRLMRVTESKREKGFRKDNHLDQILLRGLVRRKWKSLCSIWQQAGH